MRPGLGIDKNEENFTLLWTARWSFQKKKEKPFDAVFEIDGAGGAGKFIFARKRENTRR